MFINMMQKSNAIDGGKESFAYVSEGFMDTVVSAVC